MFLLHSHSPGVRSESKTFLCDSHVNGIRVTLDKGAMEMSLLTVTAKSESFAPLTIFDQNVVKIRLVWTSYRYPFHTQPNPVMAIGYVTGH